MYRRFGKRALDIILSGGALLCLSPLLLGVTAWLHFANKGAGAFFYQPRPGKGGKIFKVVKFKSMTDERGPDGKLLPDSERLTKPGRLVRVTSLDELPQLWNVLKGDMSLIGPRPFPTTYLPFYTEDEFHRHDVRPGITGLAQINGRTALDWPKRIEYDLKYINNLSLSLDIKIFCLTIYKIFKRENVGVDTSGQKNFFDYRVLQWEEKGRKDLIMKAMKSFFNLREKYYGVPMDVPYKHPLGRDKDIFPTDVK